MLGYFYSDVKFTLERLQTLGGEMLGIWLAVYISATGYNSTNYNVKILKEYSVPRS
jgi:hypothetical protein